MDVQHWPVYPPFSLTGCKLFSTQRRDLFSQLENTIMLLHCCESYIGCEYQNASLSGWQCWLTDVNITLRHIISPVSSNASHHWNHDGAFDLRQLLR
jgi:hypothetical protein